MSDNTEAAPSCQDIAEPVPKMSVQQDSPQQEPVRKGKNCIYCRVPSCGKVLNNLKRYHKRYRICPEHLKMSHVMMEGINCRFCQLCGKFQPLCDFDGAKRSCRAKLARHNERRQKCKDEEIILDVYTEPCPKRVSDQDVKKEPTRAKQGEDLTQHLFKGLWNPAAAYMLHNRPRNDPNYLEREGMPAARVNGTATFSHLGMPLPQHPGPQDMDALLKSLLSQPVGGRRTNQIHEGAGFQRYMGNPHDVPLQHFQPGPFGYGHSGQYTGLNAMLGNPLPDTRFQFQGLKQDTAVHLLMGLLEYLTNGHLAQS